MIDLDRIDLTPPDPNETEITILKDEPNRFDSDLSAFDHFLVGAAMKGASDINISADLRMRVQLHGDHKTPPADHRSAGDAGASVVCQRCDVLGQRGTAFRLFI